MHLDFSFSKSLRTCPLVAADGLWKVAAGLAGARPPREQGCVITGQHMPLQLS